MIDDSDRKMLALLNEDGVERRCQEEGCERPIAKHNMGVYVPEFDLLVASVVSCSHRQKYSVTDVAGNGGYRFERLDLREEAAASV